MKFLALAVWVMSMAAYGTSYPSNLRSLILDQNLLAQDLKLILKKANLPEDSVTFSISTAAQNSVRLKCDTRSVHLDVKAQAGEQASTFYKGLKELGFLFPHPRTQMSPALKELRERCGRTVLWKPALKIRGLHLHTLHPSEWVHGFYMDHPEIALEIVRWLARNGQNLLDVSLLRIPLGTIEKKFKAPLTLAQGLEIHTGVSLGIAVQQQKTFKLINLWECFTGFGADEKIERSLNEILSALPLSFVVLEAGTSEFTPTNYDKTLGWLNLAGKVTRKKGVALFTKIHVSSNQFHSKWGNYNFLPQYATSDVGIWPHTVMFYGLHDGRAPMYGNKNFSGIRDFMEKQKEKRPTWYYPETGYWIGMDQDIPLLLTDYLRTRAQDMKWLHEKGYEGQANFTTGHALGGWLWDWGIALLNDLDHDFDPLTPLRLLGENTELWKKHLDFQQHWFKDQNLISYLSAANLQDELTTHRIHERYTMKELSLNPIETKKEIKKLEAGLKEWPSLLGIKNEELKGLLEVTKLRHEHALEIRRSLVSDKAAHIQMAQQHRLRAQEIIKKISLLPTSYVELAIFKRHSNPTSYQFGYVYLALTTYFWEREERQIRDNSFFPFKENIIDVWEILF